MVGGASWVEVMTVTIVLWEPPLDCVMMAVETTVVTGAGGGGVDVVGGGVDVVSGVGVVVRVVVEDVGGGGGVDEVDSILVVEEVVELSGAVVGLELAAEFEGVLLVGVSDGDDVTSVLVVLDILKSNSNLGKTLRLRAMLATGQQQQSKQRLPMVSVSAS